MNEFTRAEFLALVRSQSPAYDIGDVDREIWQPFIHNLNGVKGVFCLRDDRYEREFLPVTSSFDDKCHCFGFLESSRLGTIVNSTYDKDSTITYTISFDTNYASYLSTFYESKNLGANRDAFFSSLEFLINYQSGLDCQCYLFENFEKLNTPDCIRTLQAYVAFKHADPDAFVKHKSIAPTITGHEINDLTDSIVNLTNNSDFATLYDRAWHNYLTAAVCLHKMAEISMFTKSTPKKQLIQFLQYLDDSLAFFPLREVFLAHTMFTMKPRLSFFGPIQRNSSTLLARLHAMSWDISHLRTILDFTAMASRNPHEATFPIPYFITFDRPFAALRPFIQGKALLYFDDPMRTEVVYSSNSDEQIQTLLGDDTLRFFGEAGFRSRQQRRPPEDSDWTPMLEDQLMQIKDSIRSQL